MDQCYLANTCGPYKQTLTTQAAPFNCYIDSLKKLVRNIVLFPICCVFTGSPVAHGAAPLCPQQAPRRVVLARLLTDLREVEEPFAGVARVDCIGQQGLVVV